MSDTTKIQWADATFNPWEGCTKVSPGCAHCYAEARNLRFSKGANWGKGKPRRRTSAATWRNPVKWSKTPIVCDDCGTAQRGAMSMDEGCVNGDCASNLSEHATGSYHRMRIFPSLCDWLDDEVPIEWLADFLKLIHDTPNLDWLLLTKRPENYFDRVHGALEFNNVWNCNPEQVQCLPNMWIGTSVEDQPRADERIPELLKIPARVRFLSVEPLLGEIRLTGRSPFLIWEHKGKPCCTEKSGYHRYGEGLPEKHQTPNVDYGGGIHWVIVGGESGPKARPCNVEWIRSVVAQCKAAGVPVFVKQLGSKPVEFTYSGNMAIKPENKRAFSRSLTLKDPKGGDPSEWPEDLRMREFPILDAVSARV